jgi:hypothetical protein
MRRKGSSLMPVLAFCFFLAGCAGPQLAQIREQMGTAPSRVELKGVPLFPQEAQQCGAAALAMVLQWSGLPTTPEALVPEVYSPALKGSLQPAIVGAARRSGRVAYPISGTKALLQEVAAGHPVIVLVNLGLSWYPKWHYAVVTGYDLSEGFVVLHSGKIEPEYLPFRVFQNTWARSHRWGLLVLGPGDPPVTAGETAYLAAVLGLEKARRWHEAVKGYQTALQQWPGSLPALMGLGNSFYALRELPRAANAFQEAARFHPASGAAFNNLAQVLWEEGRREKALAAAQKAVALGGPLADTYRKTLKEIQSGTP